MDPIVTTLGGTVTVRATNDPRAEGEPLGDPSTVQELGEAIEAAVVEYFAVRHGLNVTATADLTRTDR